MMTYIDYINQFWQVVKTGSVPSSAVAVYFFLLHVCNSFFWKMPFPCSTTWICEELRISRQTFTKARSFLADLKLISFTEGSARFSHATYNFLQVTGDLTEQQTAEVTEDLTEGLTGDMTCNKDKDTEEENTISESPSLCAKPLSASSPTPATDVDFNAFQVFFNQCVTRTQIPPIKSMSNKRKGMVRARIKEHGKNAVAEVIRKAAASDFLNGGTGRFIASFDWIFKPNNFLKISEGNYDKIILTNNNSNGRQQFNSKSGRRTAEDIYGGAARAIASLEQEAQQPQGEIPVV